MENIAVSIQNLTKSYKLYNAPFDRVKEAFSFSHKTYSTEKCVLNHVNVDIRKGEVVGIVGTNGAGKSTLLKIVTGVLTPSEGQVKIDGKIAALLELGTGFNPEFTGLKNIFLNGTMMGFTHEEMEKKLQSIIDFADIGDFIYQPVKIYSSGMFARLAFAVAINVDPEVLIVDEALSVGDLRFQMKCMDKMKSMMDGGVTVLFVSHDINAIRRLCTKGLWLKDGEVQAYGDTNRVCDLYMDYLKMMNAGEETAEELSADEEPLGEGMKEFVPGGKDAIAEIAGICLRDSKGNKVDTISWDEPLTVEVFYDVYDEKVETPVLGVALKRIDDEYICGVNTLLDGEIIPWNYGRNCCRLVYPEGIRVLGGGYYFDVGMFDKTATVPIEYRGKIMEFTVTADYIGEGVCILPHQWKTKEKKKK